MPDPPPTLSLIDLHAAYQRFQQPINDTNVAEAMYLIQSIPALMYWLGHERNEHLNTIADLRQAESALATAQGEIARLRKALGAYADPENWEDSHPRKDLVWDVWGREGEYGYEIAMNALAHAQPKPEEQTP